MAGDYCFLAKLPVSASVRTPRLNRALELGSDALDVLGWEFVAEGLADNFGPQWFGGLIEHGEDAGVVPMLEQFRRGCAGGSLLDVQCLKERLDVHAAAAASCRVGMFAPVRRRTIGWVMAQVDAGGRTGRGVRSSGPGAGAVSGSRTSALPSTASAAGRTPRCCGLRWAIPMPMPRPAPCVTTWGFGVLVRQSHADGAADVQGEDDD